MGAGKNKRLILFSDTFPYGCGETFLAGELPFLAERFKEIVIFPLYIPVGSDGEKDCGMRGVPSNVIVEEPLIPFDHKDRKRLLFWGLFSRTIQPYALRELFVRTVLGKSCAQVPPETREKHVSVGRRLWIYFDYLLLMRAVLGRKRLVGKLLKQSKAADLLYFYWGDKSVMIAGELKKKLSSAAVSGKTGAAPKICARFHGSDLYEHAKGYLPFRKEIFRSLDYASPVSYDGERYIRENYPDSLPEHLKTNHLGSFRHDAYNACAGGMPALRKVFRLVSCSNVMELKRVSLILDAVKLIVSDRDRVSELKRRGWSGISWKHMGDGALLKSLRQEAEVFLSDTDNRDFASEISFAGRVRHEEVLEFYKNTGADLFILTSRSEGVPVSVMEAMSFGIPAMVTNVGGVSELFAFSAPVGELLSPNPTAEEVADSLFRFMMLPGKAHANLRSNAFANWRENWDAAKNYSDFAESLISL